MGLFLTPRFKNTSWRYLCTSYSHPRGELWPLFVTSIVPWIYALPIVPRVIEPSRTDTSVVWGSGVGTFGVLNDFQPKTSRKMMFINHSGSIVHFQCLQTSLSSCDLYTCIPYIVQRRRYFETYSIDILHNKPFSTCTVEWYKRHT